MEYFSLIVFCGFVIASVLVVILISIVGTREKSYEEAIAEQRQKAQEIAFQAKSEKGAKDKKKKHVKKSKDKKEKAGNELEKSNRQLEMTVLQSSLPTGLQPKGKSPAQNKILPNSKTATKSNVDGAVRGIVSQSMKKPDALEQLQSEKELKKKVVREAKVESQQMKIENKQEKAESKQVKNELKPESKQIQNVIKPEENNKKKGLKNEGKVDNKQAKNEKNLDKKLIKNEDKENENKAKLEKTGGKNNVKADNKSVKVDKKQMKNDGKIENQQMKNDKVEPKQVKTESKQLKIEKSNKNDDKLITVEKPCKAEKKVDNKSTKSNNNKQDNGNAKKTDASDVSAKVLSDASSKKQNANNKNDDDVISKSKAQNLNSKKEGSSLPPSPTKKAKRQRLDFGSGDNGMNGTHLATVLRNAILTDTELQTLIDILLNRQQEGESWVKLGQKIDPISALKKQLQETEQKLADEQLLSQTTSNKIKEIRQELNKSVQMERSTREKLAAQQQECQTLQMHFQHSHEQHVNEINSLQIKFQQIQVKTGEEHHLAMQRLQEENEKMQQALAQMEANAKNVTSSEIARLQCDVEQWRLTCEQYKEQLATSQSSENELQQRSHQMQQCIQDVTATKAQQEKAMQQEISDLLKRLTQMEAGNNSLQRDMCNYQNLQAENNSLHNQIRELETANNNYCHRAQDLEDQLHAAKADTKACVHESEAKQREFEQESKQIQDEMKMLSMRLDDTRNEISTKDLLLAKQQNDLTRYLDEVQRLTKELDVQQGRNDALRQKNWKAMEAVSIAEKLAEEKCKQLRETVSASEKQLQRVKEELERIFPDCIFSQDQELFECLKEVEMAAKQSQSYASLEEELKQCKSEWEEKEKTLSSQIQHYKEVLQNTEFMLTTLQRRVEDEELVWKEKLSYKENDFRQIEEQLVEMQSKLHIEENERKLAELKTTEISKLLHNVEQHLDEKNKQYAELETQETTLNNQIQQLETQSDGEKKTIKDLNSQIVKLNSLVRIGEDSLRAEQEVVRELQKKVADQKHTATNGTSLNDTIDAMN